MRERKRARASGRFLFQFAILHVSPCNLSYFRTKTLQVVLKLERIFFLLFFFNLSLNASTVSGMSD